MLLSILRQIPFFLMTLLAILLFASTLVYWSFRPDVNFLLTKQVLVTQPMWRTAFYIHIFAGMLAIVLGPAQFIKGLRNHFLNVHRFSGKLYAGAIILLGAPTGLYMAFYATGGFPASIGFTIMSGLWFYTTWMGIHSIRKRNITLHRQWMLRSYAVTFSAVTLRLWVPILSLVFGMDHLQVVVITAWISWLFNLLFIECLIQFNLKKTTIYENKIV